MKQTRAGRGRATDAKRLQLSRDAGPDTKRQKLEKPWSESFSIVDIDPDGDLMVKAEGDEFAFNIDSNALRRASPELYQQCLAVRPNDGSGSNWQFDGMPATSKVSANMVLSLIHGNMGAIPEFMDFGRVYDAVFFAIRCKMLDRYHVTLKQWYHAIRMPPPERQKSYNCCRLWLADKLALKDEFMALQEWAIYNLCDNGNGALGDPSEIFPPQIGEPLDLSRMVLSDSAITGKFILVIMTRECDADPTHILDRITKLRLDAVDLILTNLRELQLALISTRTGSIIGDNFEFSGCQRCLDRWFSCLSRGLLHPQTVSDSLGPEFPSLFPLIEAKDYHRSLEDLCVFVRRLELQIYSYWPGVTFPTCTGKERESLRSCIRPSIGCRLVVENLVGDGLGYAR